MNSVQDQSETYMRTTTGKITASGLCRILFFGCFFVSIFVANTIWKNEASWVGYLHETMVSDLSIKLEGNLSYLKNVLVQRLPVWLFLLIMGRTMIGMIGAQIYSAWQGFMLGFLLAALIIRYGFAGVIVYGLLGFPQMLVYVLAYVLLYRKNFLGWKYKKESERYGEVISGSARNRLKHFLSGIALSMLFLLGIVLESYVNLIFLSKMVMLMKVL